MGGRQKKTDILRGNGQQESVESVLKEEKSQQWEGFVKQVGLSQEWNSEGAIDRPYLKDVS